MVTCCCRQAARAQANASAGSTPSAQRCNSDVAKMQSGRVGRARSGLGSAFSNSASKLLEKLKQGGRQLTLSSRWVHAVHSTWKGSKTSERHRMNRSIWTRCVRCVRKSLSLWQVWEDVCRCTWWPLLGAPQWGCQSLEEPQMWWRYYLYKNYMGNPTRETETEKVSASEPDFEEPLTCFWCSGKRSLRIGLLCRWGFQHRLVGWASSEVLSRRTGLCSSRHGKCLTFGFMSACNVPGVLLCFIVGGRTLVFVLGVARCLSPGQIPRSPLLELCSMCNIMKSHDFKKISLRLIHDI